MAQREDWDEIYSLWLKRPPESRQQSDVPAFSDEVWGLGLRVAKQQHLHYQTLMQRLRAFCTHRP